MHRIDGPGSVGGAFTEGDPQAGQPPTTVTSDWLNDTQEQIAQAIEAQGITLVKGNGAQLSQAIALAASARQSYRNLLQNASFEISQRSIVGTGQSNTAQPWAGDRWFMEFDAGVQVDGVATIFNNSTLQFAPTPFARGKLAILDVAKGAATVRRVRQRIEDVRTLSGTKATLSFWARATGAIGTTGLTITPSVRQYHGPAGDPDVVTNFPPLPLVKPSGSVGEWTRYSATITIPPSGFIWATGFPGQTTGAVPPDGSALGYLEFRLDFGSFTGTGTQNVEISLVQLEEGGVSTAFEQRPLTIETALCERYYEQSWGIFGSPVFLGADPWSHGASRGRAVGTRAMSLATRFRQTKAKFPTVTWYSPVTGAAGVVRWGAADVAVTQTNDAYHTSTGDPEVGSSQADANVLAQWTAEAEL